MLKRLIIEIRYPSAPHFLDIRGEIIKEAKRYFRKWIASGINHLEVFDEDRKMRGFVSTKRAGMTMLEPNTQVFKDTSRNFLNKVFEKIGVNLNELQRIGVRSIFAIPYDNSFENLLSIFKSKMLKVEDRNMPEGFKIVDVGFPLNFTVNDKKCNISFGPMEKSQFKQFIQGTDNIPDVGAYFDVDYFKENPRPGRRIANVSIGDYLNEGIDTAQEMKDYFKNFLNL